jgi:hypothetical protein
VRGELAEDLAEQRRILEAKKQLRQVGLVGVGVGVRRRIMRAR